MAFSGSTFEALYGLGILGQAQAQRTTTSGHTSSGHTLWIDELERARQFRDVPSPPKTLRQELQAEVDEWLPQLAA